MLAITFNNKQQQLSAANTWHNLLGLVNAAAGQPGHHCIPAADRLECMHDLANL
jgi:hypothetical protein